MTDCGVCLDPGDYDYPELCSEANIKARKERRCCECGHIISAGAVYQRVKGKWDGYFGTYNTCLDCVNIRDAFRCGGGFIFGGLWDSLWEFRDDVNTGCVEKIKTVSAKQKYMDWLRQARGIDE